MQDNGFSIGYDPYASAPSNMSGDPLTMTVSEFVTALNQTLEYAYPGVTVTGELANFRVSKNRWVYFDLKDNSATVRFFGTTYQLPGPLEDGMMLAVRGVPKLHPLYGFSVTVQSMSPTGEGSIKKAAKLLQEKLAKEGLFDPQRKRTLPYPPRRIGLITSGESAAYRDFMKIINARWGGMEIELIDVQVQGEPSPAQVTAAIAQFNQMADAPDVLVITRGGGSAEDLQAFSTEQVTRAVAASRIPTVVAIGHEVDTSLAELAADQRASTPSNAAELLVPDRTAIVRHVRAQAEQLESGVRHRLQFMRQQLTQRADQLRTESQHVVTSARQKITTQKQLLQAYDPQTALTRGYALVRAGNAVIRRGAQLQIGTEIQLQFADSDVAAHVTHVTMKQEK